MAFRRDSKLTGELIEVGNRRKMQDPHGESRRLLDQSPSFGGVWIRAMANWSDRFSLKIASALPASG